MIFLSRGIFLLGSKKKLAPYLLFKTKEKSLEILEKKQYSFLLLTTSDMHRY